VQVLYHARNHYGVAKGIKEVCQALERGEAQLVILAEDCDHEGYVKLVTALTAEKGVYLIKVPEKAKLGDWAGTTARAGSCTVRRSDLQSAETDFCPRPHSPRTTQARCRRERKENLPCIVRCGQRLRRAGRHVFMP